MITNYTIGPDLLNINTRSGSYDSSTLNTFGLWRYSVGIVRKSVVDT